MIHIINDVHIGVRRQAGTTPQTQAALHDMPFQFLAQPSPEGCTTLVINGDLFNSFEVETADIIRTYEILEEKLLSRSIRIVLIAGNHDASAKGERASSFALLSRVMSSYGDYVRTIEFNAGLKKIDAMTWAIPHMVNQAAFDEAIENAVYVGAPKGAMLLLHCNAMSGFAEQQDHSLNLSKDQAERLIRSGWKLVLGHEHIACQKYGGNLIVVGNQVPTSISDVHGEDAGIKRSITWDGETIRYVSHGSYQCEDIDWREIRASDAPFVRIVGECSTDEASEVVSAISAYRKTSEALIVSNSVKIDGVVSIEGLDGLNLENVQSFDIMAALLPLFDEDERPIVKELRNAV